MDSQERAKGQGRLYKEVYRVCIVGLGARGVQGRRERSCLLNCGSSVETVFAWPASPSVMGLLSPSLPHLGLDLV